MLRAARLQRTIHRQAALAEQEGERCRGFQASRKVQQAPAPGLGAEVCTPLHPTRCCLLRACWQYVL